MEIQNSYPRNANGSLSFSLKGAKEFALNTGDHALLMQVATVETVKAKASVFKAKMAGAGDRIKALEAKIAEEREILTGGEGELNALQVNAKLHVDGFEEYVRDNHSL